MWNTKIVKGKAVFLLSASCVKTRLDCGYTMVLFQFFFFLTFFHTHITHSVRTLNENKEKSRVICIETHYCTGISMRHARIKSKQKMIFCYENSGLYRKMWKKIPLSNGCMHTLFVGCTLLQNNVKDISLMIKLSHSCCEK